MPDRAGAKTPWLDILKFIFKVIPLLPGIIANRVSVVDPRVHEVGDPLRRVLFGLVH
jgi:hypothetical protein